MGSWNVRAGKRKVRGSRDPHQKRKYFKPKSRFHITEGKSFSERLGITTC